VRFIQHGVTVSSLSLDPTRLESFFIRVVTYGAPMSFIELFYQDEWIVVHKCGCSLSAPMRGAYKIAGGGLGC
jgi:hypothetical protein